MRRPSSTGLAAAAILALAGGLLAGCGGSGDLIPASRAADLRTELDAVKTAVDNGNCDAAGQAVARARGDVLNLPASVDQDLRARLQEGVDSLARLVPSECGSSGSSTAGDQAEHHAGADRHVQDGHAGHRHLREDDDHADPDPDDPHADPDADPADDPEHPEHAGARHGRRVAELPGHAVSTVTIAGRYELGRRLGVGGMSTVMLARDHRLEREVAVKVLAEHLADDSQFVTRFRREALNAAQLVHPNIVQVFDFGFDEDTGRHFIVMEYVARPVGRGAAARRGPPLGERRAGHRHPELPRAGLRAPQRRRPPRRQARQPAARRGRDGQAGRLRHRQGAERGVVDHPGGIGAGHRRLPGAGAGARGAGRPAGGPLRPGRRRPTSSSPGGCPTRPSR